MGFVNLLAAPAVKTKPQYSITVVSDTDTPVTITASRKSIREALAEIQKRAHDQSNEPFEFCGSSVRKIEYSKHAVTLHTS